MSIDIVGVSGSPGIHARSRIIVAEVVRQFVQKTGLRSELIDLNVLSADALLGRQRDNQVDEKVATVVSARVVVIGTPVYRASYAGQLKAFFDLLPQGGMQGVVVALVATGAGSAHSLVIDHALRPLVASLGGLSAANGMYITDGQFPDKTQIPTEVHTKIEALVNELVALAIRKDVA